MPARPSRDNSPHRDEAKALGVLIRETRQKKMSQQKLAERAKVSIGTLRALERGRSVDPSFFTVMAIAAELGLSPSQLVATASLKAEPAKRVGKPARAPVSPKAGSGST